MNKLFWSKNCDPKSWNTDMKTIRFPFNIERLIRWCHKYNFLKWIDVGPDVIQPVDFMDLLLPKFDEIAKDNWCRIFYIGVLPVIMKRTVRMGVPIKFIHLDTLQIQKWFDDDDYEALDKYIIDCCDELNRELKND